MENLSRNQLKILKKSRFLPRVYKEYGSSDRAIVDELASYGLLDPSSGLVMLTEKGKAHLRYERKLFIRLWFPIAISAISLIVSIIALSKTQ